MKKRIAIACSGGVDSLTLLHMVKYHPEHLAQELLPQEGVSELQHEYVVLHFDHGLRESSAEEQGFVELQAEKYGFEFHGEKVRDPYEKGSLELWAREHRYGFFKEMVQKHQIQEVWTAHHLDDQVETLWLRLERGTGLRGLRGVGLKRRLSHNETGEAMISRPILHQSKEFLIQYAQENGIEWMEDESNHDVVYRRNYWRHTGRDVMRQLGGPEIEQKLLEIALKTQALWPKIRADLESFEGRWSDLLDQETEFIALFVDELYSQHPAFRGGWTEKYAQEIKKWYFHGRKDRFPLRDYWFLERGSDGLTLVEIRPKVEFQGEKCSIGGTATAVLGDKMYFLETQTIPSSQVEALNDSAFSTFLELEDTSLGLELRLRQPGDLFSPAPGKFSKRTLKKFMNESGIPSSERSSTLVVAQGQRILWIPQWGVSGLHQEPSSQTTRVKLKLIWQNKTNADK